MKNQVIKVLNAEHAEKVKEYFKYLGYDIGDFDNPNEKLETNTYYGVINGVFDAYMMYSQILKNNAEIIELPINSKTPKLPKNKVGRPKLTQEEKIRIAKSRERVKKRFQKKELSKNLNNVLSARIPTETYKLCEDAAKAKGKSISEYLRDEILNKKQPLQFDLPKPTETPKVTKVVTFDLSIYSNGKTSLFFECDNHSFVNNFIADVSQFFSQQNPIN